MNEGTAAWWVALQRLFDANVAWVAAVTMRLAREHQEAGDILKAKCMDEQRDAVRKAVDDAHKQSEAKFQADVRGLFVLLQNGVGLVALMGVNALWSQRAV